MVSHRVFVCSLYVSMCLLFSVCQVIQGKIKLIPEKFDGINFSNYDTWTKQKWLFARPWYLVCFCIIITFCFPASHNVCTNDDALSIKYIEVYKITLKLFRHHHTTTTTTKMDDVGRRSNKTNYICIKLFAKWCVVLLLVRSNIECMSNCLQCLLFASIFTLLYTSKQTHVFTSLSILSVFVDVFISIHKKQTNKLISFHHIFLFFWCKAATSFVCICFTFWQLHLGKAKQASRIVVCTCVCMYLLSWTVFTQFLTTRFRSNHYFILMKKNQTKPK